MLDRRRALAQLAGVFDQVRGYHATRATFELGGALADSQAANPPPGMTGLGTIVVRRGASSASHACFVDAARTTVLSRCENHLLQVVSFTPADEYLTVVAKQRVSCAVPPFLHREDLAERYSESDAILVHRQRVAKVADLVAIASLESFVAILDERAQREQTWRSEQDIDRMLELDLRGFLGPHYDRLGPRLARRVHTGVPEARALS